MKKQNSKTLTYIEYLKKQWIRKAIKDPEFDPEYHLLNHICWAKILYQS